MTKYFHGSASLLEEGDFLLPGSVTGVKNFSRIDHVYMVHTDFEFVSYGMSGHHPEYIDTAEKYALWDALMWACTAGDLRCGGKCDSGENDHADMLSDLTVPDCVYVYEVEPIGGVEPDGASDTGPEHVRAPKAVIARALPANEIARQLGW